MIRDPIYYKRDSYLVTSRNFKAKRRGYRLSAITRVDLCRTYFYLLLPALIGVMSLVIFFQDLLYTHEIFLCVFSTVMLGIGAWSVGTINLKGFNVDGIAAFGLYWRMAELKEALDHALMETDIQQMGIGNSGMSSHENH